MLLLLCSFLSPAVAPADRVAPNIVVTYKWLVNERAGPGPADAGSIMWMYILPVFSPAPAGCCCCCCCSFLPAAVAPADRVAPNSVVTYKWLVNERAGPGPADAGSIMWMYHSHVDEAADPAAGLMGAIIITSPENANEDATPKDVSRCGIDLACGRTCLLGAERDGRGRLVLRRHVLLSCRHHSAGLMGPIIITSRGPGAW
jgi:hypothetical protein